MSDPDQRRLKRSTLTQAARFVEQLALRSGCEAEVGRDAYPGEEPIRFLASDRMALAANDVVDADARGEQFALTVNVLGLAGATPALPPVYSELQLQRRRLRDFAFARFLNLFDHRALSFFYRIARKFAWPLLAERAGKGQPDPVASALISVAGLSTEGVRARLDLSDAALVPLVPHLADARRSAASVETVLRHLTGLPLRVVQACPVWMAVPETEQSRLSGIGSQSAQLGGRWSAMIGAAVLDVQHHYIVEIGPVSYAQIQAFCGGSEARRVVSQLCVLAAGLEHRPSIRLLIRAGDIPPLRLGDDSAPALLGWTSWTGAPEGENGIVADCVIPIDRSAIN
ncbi:type VI secretion system baseplate subunit TssG [Sphingomonas sp. MAH-20]|uniref:Type VI secretion system baseplate subunit TssG n=1 Tax=Sphingomonas horti TaxID=2682842 RepID=A0A6I4IXD9_9SPHN|nr:MULTISPECIES: type VI secretion system baseplate subunit TssG [Sphingomonas]MBA2920547.1 type VI secretion system baseplate subunit TssG [Sphingomonas sp. CGMCC 1.13658]MVO76799.1 type VI secretion system baseplate subunit TssG [Sphingomonas horti]